MNSQSSLRAFFNDLRKKKIIEILAAFIGGGWLLVEVVERLLVGHYKFPEETIDLTVISIIGALFATLVWRWFCGRDKRPGNIKFEVLLVPLILLATVAIDLVIVLKTIGVPGKSVFVAAVAVCLGIGWIVLKSLQWAAAAAPVAPGPILASEDLLNSVSTPPEKSIIVLPFENISPDPEQDYFCDGMTEEIITDLSHVHDLLVISRSSAMTFKGTRKTVPEITRAVNVRYIMEGSVRKAGNDLRISAQLIDAVTDAHIWAEKYSGTLDDVFDIQEKVARSIVDALKLKLTPEEKRRMAERSIDDVTAYECYLRAMAEIWKCQENSINLAIRYFQRGLEIVGDNALLYSGMAFAYWQYVNIGFMQEEGLKKAEELVIKALALEPDYPKAHAVLGWLGHFGGKFQEAVGHFKRALSVSPDDPFALQGLLGAYIVIGKISAATPLCERLLRIDPLDFITNMLQMILPFYDGDYGRALPRSRKLYEMYSANPYAQFVHAVTLAYNGNIKEAFSVVDQNASANPDNAPAILGLMLKHALLKEKEKVFRLITPDFHATCLRDSTFGHQLAGVFSLLDEKTEALDWLEDAINAGFINYPLLSEKDPFLANIRGEERFKKLMERVKYEWEHFEV